MAAAMTDEEKQRIAQQMQGNNSAEQANQVSNAQQTSNANTAAAMQNTNASRNATQATYPFQRTFQSPSASQPGQQTPMPWSGLAQGMQNIGRPGAATPWGQTMQAPQTPMQGQQAAPGGMPNWQALMQRFGGGNAQTPSPAFQQPRFQAPPWMQGGGGQGGQGFQLPPWLQQAAAGIAARGGGGFQLPGFGGPQGATPAWGGGMAQPNWGGGQGLPIFNQQRNTY